MASYILVCFHIEKISFLPSAGKAPKKQFFNFFGICFYRHNFFYLVCIILISSLFRSPRELLPAPLDPGHLKLRLKNRSSAQMRIHTPLGGGFGIRRATGTNIGLVSHSVRPDTSTELSSKRCTHSSLRSS